MMISMCYLAENAHRSLELSLPLLAADNGWPLVLQLCRNANVERYIVQHLISKLLFVITVNKALKKIIWDYVQLRSKT